MLLAAWLLLLSALTLLTAGITYSDSVALGGMHRALLDGPASARSIDVAATSPLDGVVTLDATVSGILAGALGQSGGEVDLIATADPYAPVGTDAEDSSRLVRIASMAGIEGHARLAAGQWPAPAQTPMQASLSDAAANALGLKIGDSLALASRQHPDLVQDVVVTGIWQPDASDPYWLERKLELDGVEQVGPFTTRGPLVVTEADLLARTVSGQAALEWRALPAIERIRVDDIGTLRDQVASAGDRLRAALPRSQGITVSSDLPAALDDIGHAVVVSRGGVLLLTVEFAVLAGYAVVLVAGTLADRRKTETALLRSRGAHSGHLLTLALGEGLLLVGTAALLAPILAVAIVSAIVANGSLAPVGADVTLSSTALLVTVLAALGCLVALLLPALGPAAMPAGVRAALGRSGGRTLGQRLGIDLVLLVLAGLAIWQLRLYGAPLTRDARGALGLDPLLVAAPAIGLLAGAVVATRFMPRIAELLERLAGGARGVVAPSSTRQLARRPLRSTRAALLLILAAALGTFAAVYQATWMRSQNQQAAFQAPTDARVIVSDYPQLPSWAVGPAYRALPGVTAAAPVVRQALEVGRVVRRGQLMGIDPAAAAGMSELARESSEPAIADLLAGLAPTPEADSGTVLPGTAARMAVTVDAALAPTDGSLPPTEDAGRITISTIIANADGVHRIDGASTTLTGSGVRLEVPLSVAVGDTAVTPSADSRLLGIELHVSGPSGVPIGGTLAVTGLSVLDAGSGAWSDVPFDPVQPAWAWTRLSDQGASPYEPLESAPARSISETVRRGHRRSSPSPVRRPSLTGWRQRALQPRLCRPSSMRVSWPRRRPRSATW